MMGLVYFLGRLHVLALHLPIGILTLAVALEILVRFRPFAFLRPALTPTWVAGALTAILSAALGLMHATEGAFQDSPAVDAHRLAGLGLTAAACLIAILRLRTPAASWTWPQWASRTKLDRAYQAAAPHFAPGTLYDRITTKAWPAYVAVTLVLLFLTGHLGGNLTHGDTYLVEYAPAPIRWLAGASPETAPRDKPKDVASADIYLDVVAPALRERCASCHNDSKRGGGLSLVTYATAMKGGKAGPVIIVGDPAKSDLLRRISLPEEHKDFMPKDGKTPLSKAQVTAIGWWIAQGAPKTAQVSKLKMTAGVAPALQQALGLGGEALAEEETGTARGPDENAGLPTVPVADPKLVASLEKAGFIIRPVSKTSNLLDVDYTLPRPLPEADLATLAKLGPQVLRLNLRGAGLSDAQMKTVAGFKNLRRLRLEGNAVTDAGVAQLAPLKELRYLNLVGAPVTDASLTAMGALPKLHEVYLWRSGVTDEGLARFRTDHPTVLADAGVKPEDVTKETLVLAPR